MPYRLVIPALLLALAGCQERSGGKPGAATEAAPRAAVQSAQSAQNESALRVTLLPAAPKTGDSIRATVRGGAATRLHWYIDGDRLEGHSGAVLPAGTARKGQKVEVVAQSGAEKAAASVVIANTPPRITAVSFSDPAVHRGVGIEVSPRAEDADGDPVRFDVRWVVNGEEVPFVDGPFLPGDHFRRGDRILVEVTPFDGEEHGPPFRGAELEIPNAPPAFVSEPPAAFTEEGYRYRVRAEDPDGHPLTYYLEEGPAGMRIDAASGELFWGIADIRPGDHRVRIGVHDTEGMNARQEFVLSVNQP